VKKFSVLLLAAIGALALGGCIQSREVIFPRGGERLWITSDAYSCGGVGASREVVRFREVVNGDGTYAYVSRTARPGDPNAPVYTFFRVDPMNPDRYLAVITVRENGMPVQDMLPVQISGHALVGVMPTAEKLAALAEKYNVNVDGETIGTIMRGSAAAKRALMMDLAAHWNWSEVTPFYECYRQSLTR